MKHRPDGNYTEDDIGYVPKGGDTTYSLVTTGWKSTLREQLPTLVYDKKAGKPLEEIKPVEEFQGLIIDTLS